MRSNTILSYYNIYRGSVGREGWRGDGAPSRTGVPDNAQGLVGEHRAILGLGLGDHVSDDWLKNHPSNVFKYFHHILQDMEEPIGRQRRSLRTWVKKQDAFKGSSIEE